jgi:pantoate--beta-alanine ligase
MPLDIVISRTVREPDGLAMSSRNAYLDATARQHALSLVGSLRAAARAFDGGERSGGRLTSVGRDTFTAYPDVAVDYFAVVDPVHMREVETASRDSVAIVAARVGKTRLIDNMIIGDRE